MPGPMLTYRIGWPKPHRHRLEVLLEIDLSNSAVDGTLVLTCPIWRPGRYYSQDFAGGLLLHEATNEAGEVRTFRQTGHGAWTVDVQPSDEKICVAYQVAAHRLDAGSTFVGPHLLQLNPITFGLCPIDALDVPIRIELEDLPANWQVATALANVGNGQYAAASYHQWVDSPVLAQAKPTRWQFEVDGYAFEAAFYGCTAPNTAWKAGFIERVSNVISAQVNVWLGWPVQKTYLLQYVFVPSKLRHAVEHENGSFYVLPALICESEPAFVNGTLGITAHELFHTWNVKRLRPAPLVPYRYDALPQTELHWFTEGLTCYYEELSQVRAGVTSRETFFQRISETLTKLHRAPGSQWLSVAQHSERSLYAESRYQRPDSQVSFYDSGQIVALALDLQLRLMSSDLSLDHVLRHLYQHHLRTGFTHADLLACLQEATGADWQPFFQDWVYKAGPPDLSKIAKAARLQYRRERAPTVDLAALGVVDAQPHQAGVEVRALRENSALADAGLPLGAVLTELNGLPLALNEVRLEPGAPATLRYTYWQKGGGIALPGSVVQGQHIVTLEAGKADTAFLDGWLGPKRG